MAEKSLATYDALLQHEDCPFERPVVVYPLYATPSGMAGLGAAAAVEIEEDAATKDGVVEDGARARGARKSSLGSRRGPRHLTNGGSCVGNTIGVYIYNDRGSYCRIANFSDKITLGVAMAVTNSLQFS